MCFGILKTNPGSQNDEKKPKFRILPQFANSTYTKNSPQALCKIHPSGVNLNSLHFWGSFYPRIYFNLLCTYNFTDTFINNFFFHPLPKICQDIFVESPVYPSSLVCFSRELGAAGAEFLIIIAENILRRER